MKLYHYTTHPEVVGCNEFTLHPGKQGAEGIGVYFSEQPRKQSADAISAGGVCTGCVVIDAPSGASGWYRSKGGKARKFGKPRTWHTNGRSLSLRVVRREGEFIVCEIVN